MLQTMDCNMPVKRVVSLNYAESGDARGFKHMTRGAHFISTVTVSAFTYISSLMTGAVKCHTFVFIP